MTIARPFVSIAALAASALSSLVACAQNAPQTPELVEKWKDVSLYSIDAKTLEGEPAKLDQYAGKVTLVVNVASRCGYTPQYEGLQALYEKFKDRGLVVIGVPSGDFGGQELADAKAIREFCTSRYEVTFPLLAKSGVKAGPEQCAVFEFLGTRIGKLPGWNFSKYLVGRDGQPIEFWGSGTKPDSKELVEALEKALAATAPPTTKAG
jgi:glutathione peroxidase